MAEGLESAGADPRFAGIGRLYGAAGLARLRQARVTVVGLGGVGSWAVEALARSGVGHLTLIDYDEACLNNINRQLPALTSTVGRFKADLLAERVADIFPEAEVVVEKRFFTASTAEALLGQPCDVLLDAIDRFSNKCLLIAECRRRGIPIITCGGAGGRRDPGMVQVADLTRTYNDPLLAMVRKKLRGEYGFPRERKRKWKIECVFSPELPVYPQSDGCVSVERDPEQGSLRLSCDGGYG
ncbi:MAG: tRNA threonylcarbamoyladenosine dehydratase, partial [Verrucomicrobiota bacterium]